MAAEEPIIAIHIPTAHDVYARSKESFSDQKLAIEPQSGTAFDVLHDPAGGAYPLIQKAFIQLCQDLAQTHQKIYEHVNLLVELDEDASIDIAQAFAAVEQRHTELRAKVPEIGQGAGHRSLGSILEF